MLFRNAIMHDDSIVDMSSIETNPKISWLTELRLRKQERETQEYFRKRGLIAIPGDRYNCIYKIK